jgi:hypothetical protein
MEGIMRAHLNAPSTAARPGTTGFFFSPGLNLLGAPSLTGVDFAWDRRGELAVLVVTFVLKRSGVPAPGRQSGGWGQQDDFS